MAKGDVSLTQTLMCRYLLTLGSNSTGVCIRVNDTRSGFSVKLMSGRALLRFLKVGRLSSVKPMYILSVALGVRSVDTAVPSRLVSFVFMNSVGKFNTGISHSMLSVAFSWHIYANEQYVSFLDCRIFILTRKQWCVFHRVA